MDLASLVDQMYNALPDESKVLFDSIIAEHADLSQADQLAVCAALIAVYYRDTFYQQAAETEIEQRKAKRALRKLTGRRKV